MNSASDIAMKLHTQELVASGPYRPQVPDDDVFVLVTVVRCSPDGMFVAYGNDQGIVTVTTACDAGERVEFVDCGASITDIAWHPHMARTLVISASNGVLNCIRFEVDGQENEMSQKDTNTSVKIPGFIAGISFNDKGTVIGVAFGTEVQLVPFPFPVGSLKFPLNAVDIPLRPLTNIYPPGTPLKKVPIRYRTNPRKVYFLRDDVILVIFLAGAQAYENRDGRWQYVWRIMSIGSSMGSTALSPSRRLLVASNLNNGLDWYNLTTKQHSMTTLVFSEYQSEGRNFIHELVFLDEFTVLTGTNSGRLAIAQNGTKVVVAGLDTSGDYPCQTVSAAHTQSHVFIANAIGPSVKFWYLRSGGIGENGSEDPAPLTPNSESNFPAESPVSPGKWAPLLDLAWRFLKKHPTLVLSLFASSTVGFVAWCLFSPGQAVNQATTPPTIESKLSRDPNSVRATQSRPRAMTTPLTTTYTAPFSSTTFSQLPGRTDIPRNYNDNDYHGNRYDVEDDDDDEDDDDYDGDDDDGVASAETTEDAFIIGARLGKAPVTVTETHSATVVKTVTVTRTATVYRTATVTATVTRDRKKPRSTRSLS